MSLANLNEKRNIVKTDFSCIENTKIWWAKGCCFPCGFFKSVVSENFQINKISQLKISTKFKVKKDIFEFQRAVVYRFGRLLKKGALGPGRITLLKNIDVAKTLVDIREKPYLIPVQKLLTVDFIELEVQGLCFYEIFDPVNSFVNVQNVDHAVQELSAAVLRDAIASHNLQEILQNKQNLQYHMRVCNKKNFFLKLKN